MKPPLKQQQDPNEAVRHEQHATDAARNDFSFPEVAANGDTSGTLPALPGLELLTSEDVDAGSYDPYNSGTFNTAKYNSDE